ncbi:hypothetical protein C8J57DRAFT_1617931 [Mycena rebaudengoi]|nr:hypothetical protein C8J57DRAFT_1617931 [Mycena rebaudengoi]
MHFANALEQGMLLSHATGLKALALGNLHFDNPSVCRVDVPHEVRVFLESLELELKMEMVDAIVSGFSTVDIKHLKSLVTELSPVIPLLKANAQTIQKIRASLLLTGTDNPVPMEPPDPDILKGNQTLHLIEITAHSSWIVSVLQQFGHLGHLRALKTISLDFTDDAKCSSPSTEVDWTKLDAILSPAVDVLFTFILSIRWTWGSSDHCCRLWGRRLPCMFIENRLFDGTFELAKDFSGHGLFVGQR